jgi:hypothetical protein
MMRTKTTAPGKSRSTRRPLAFAVAKSDNRTGKVRVCDIMGATQARAYAKAYNSVAGKTGRRVYLLAITEVRLAFETDSKDDADAFADEFNKREAANGKSGLIAFADHRGAVAKRPTKKPAKRLAKGGGR